MLGNMSCPDDTVLARLVLGQLPDAEAEALAEHLEACGRCVATVEAQRIDDTLVAAARTSAGAGDESESAAVQALIDRLSGMFSAVADAPAAQSADVPDGMETADLSTDVSAILSPPQEPGELGRLGAYRVLKVLGAGGMGVVFQAEDPTLKRLVALKTLQPGIAANATARERFLREARAVAAIDDERIVPIHHVGEDRGIPFFAMPLLRGQTLEDRLRSSERETASRTLPVDEAVRIAYEAARGLASAHARGLVHRDVKPGNIFLKDEGAGVWTVKLLDFGLARAIDEEMSLTQPGIVAGTPAYIAPEQLAGDVPDERCDLFGLGCVLYRMITGRLPSSATDRLASGVVSRAPVSPAELNPAVPQELADLTLELVAQDPTHRPPSALVVAERLTEIAQGLSSVSIAPAKKRRKGLVTWVAVAAAILVVATLTVIMLVRTEHGEFVIESADPDVAVMIREAGGITLHDRKTDRTYMLAVGKHDLPTGEYEIDVREPAAKLEFSTRRFTIKRGDQARVTVSLRPLKLAPFDVWLQEVAARPAEKQVQTVADKLRELNPGFDGNVGPRFEDGKVVEVQLFTDHLTDLSPLRAFADLEMLTCRGSASEKGRLADIAPLKSLKNLVYLDFSANRVRDLGPVRGLTRLRELSCWANPVEDLRPLRDLPLESLQLDHTFVTDADLWPLRHLPLHKLHLKAPYVIDLRALAGLPLLHLYCDFRAERHPQTLRAMKSLQTINDTPIEDFWKAYDARGADLDTWTKRVAALPWAEQLPEVSAKLRQLNPGFDGKLVPEEKDGAFKLMIFSDQITDMAPLRALTRLRHLTINGSAAHKGSLYDLDPVRDLPRLEYLECGGTNVADLSALAGTKLRGLSCWGTLVRDLSPLRKLPIFFLDCQATRVQDLSPLKGTGITRLVLRGCPVTDLSPLTSMSIHWLYGDFDPARDTKILKAIKTLVEVNGQPVAEFWKEFKAK
jgi:serine/threonine protein kinase/Leucine-rich repeat (LRR) protein